MKSAVPEILPPKVRGSHRKLGGQRRDDDGLMLDDERLLQRARLSLKAKSL